MTHDHAGHGGFPACCDRCCDLVPKVLQSPFKVRLCAAMAVSAHRFANIDDVDSRLLRRHLCRSSRTELLPDWTTSRFERVKCRPFVRQTRREAVARPAELRVLTTPRDRVLLKAACCWPGSYAACSNISHGPRAALKLHLNAHEIVTVAMCCSMTSMTLWTVHT